MDLTLYGICFKMRGSLNLLDLVQSNTPVPVDIMQQVIDQMGSITDEELDFAKTIKNDWKKAFNEKVPVIMGVTEDGGYEISYTVPDELLNTVSILTGLDHNKIAEEYTADYLKNVCGIEANIISVDVNKHEPVNKENTESVQGFDITDLGAKPEEPAFEDVAAFGNMEEELDRTLQETKITLKKQEPVSKKEGIPIEEGYPEEDYQVEQANDYQEDEYDSEDKDSDGEYSLDEDDYFADNEYSDETDYSVDNEYSDETDYPAEDNEYSVDNDYPVEDNEQDEYPVEDDNPDEDYSAEEIEPDSEAVVRDAMAGIYKELVTNIREKNLDERLNLKIGK